MGAISPEFQYVDTCFCPLYLEVSFAGYNLVFFLEYLKNVTPFFSGVKHHCQKVQVQFNFLSFMSSYILGAF